MCLFDEVALQTVGSVCPDFRPTTPRPQRTSKGWIWRGELLGQPVIAKWPRRAGDLWRVLGAHEIALYESFARHGSPVRVPRLLDADPEAGLLVLERLRGTPLTHQRVVSRTLTTATVSSLVHVLAALWRAPWPADVQLAEDPLSDAATLELRGKMLPNPWCSSWPTEFLQGLRPADDHRSGPGPMSSASPTGLYAPLVALALPLLERSCPPTLGHLDLLPRNILLLDSGELALVDWESAGVSPQCAFDAGLVWASIPSEPRGWLERGLAAALPEHSEALAVGRLLGAAREVHMRRHVLRTRPDHPLALRAERLLELAAYQCTQML